MSEEKNTVSYEEIMTDDGVTGGKSNKKKQKDKSERKKEKAAKPPMDPAKKKKMRRRIILISVAAVIVIFFIVSKVMAGNNKPMVMTMPVSTGDVEQTISTSGTVETQKELTYYSELTVPIGEIRVKAGDGVNKGDVLLTYDPEALAREKELNQLTVQANDGTYNDSMTKNNKSNADLTEANVNLDVLNQQIIDTQAYIDGLEAKIQNKKDELAHFGALLQISLLDWQDQPDSDEYLNLQKMVQQNTYEQTYHKDIVSWQKELDAYNQTLTDYKEYKAKMESQQTSSEGTVMNAGGKSELEAKTKSEKIKAQATLDSIAEVEEGVKAEFDGVVTAVSVESGATPQSGAEILKLESTKDVKITISVSKYDLAKIALGQKADINIAGKTYEGEIVNIDKMASKNDNGTPVVHTDIKLLNPDDAIYLGVEAKIIIHTAKAEGALVVPIEAVNTDSNGDFVYAVENGVVVRKPVTAGISSDMYMEILDGLKEGDQILTAVTAGIGEGMEVTAVPMTAAAQQ